MTTQQRLEIALKAGTVAHAALEFVSDPPELYILQWQKLIRAVVDLGKLVGAE